MSMSDEAREGLHAAVMWNPAATGELLGILRSLPISVSKKPGDRYGVLSMMLTPHSLRVIGSVGLPVQRPPYNNRVLTVSNQEYGTYVRQIQNERVSSDAPDSSCHLYELGKACYPR